MSLLALVCMVSAIQVLTNSADRLDVRVSQAVPVPPPFDAKAGFALEQPLTAAMVEPQPRLKVRRLAVAPVSLAALPRPEGSPAPARSLHSMSMVPACQPAERTFANGEELSPVGPAVGHGRVVIINGTKSDAVVKLSPRSPAGMSRRVYVTAGQQVLLDQVDAGDYRLVFTLGTAWSLDQHKFCQSPEYSEFAKDLRFQEKRIYEQIEFDQAQVTLNGVAGGNIPVRKLSEQEFLATR